MIKTIDVHNHLYPKTWIDYIEKKGGSLKLERKSPGNFTFYYNGQLIATITKPGHYDPVSRIEDLDKYGIDVQIISMTTPSVELVPKKEGIIWAKKINDYIASVCQKYPSRFYAFATLPYQDVDESLVELERAYHDLKVKGIIIFSNINGQSISSKKYYPIYELAQKFNLPIIVHPAPPLTTEAMIINKLPLPLFGYTLDTTMAVVSLIFQGVFEKFPKLKIIHSHLGGVVPYLAQRMEDSYRSYSKEYNYRLPLSPSEYYKRQVYCDSISFHLPAMKCCLEFMGAEHILLGTDYAHPIGNLEQAVAYIRKLGLTQKDVDMILSQNAIKLFNLKLK